MIVKCKNLTNAIRANKLLAQNDIKSSVVKITDSEYGGGCIHAISFDDIFKKRALCLMKKRDIILHKTESIYYGDMCDDIL